MPRFSAHKRDSNEKQHYNKGKLHNDKVKIIE
jgi:hypothetical protein